FEARQHFQLVTGRAGSASIGRRQSAGVDWSPRHHDRLTDLFAPDGPCHRSLSNKRSHDVILGKGDPMAVMKRRTMARMRLAGALLATLTSAAVVEAETYPTRPVMMYVGFPPGGPTDTLARILADAM